MFLYPIGSTSQTFLLEDEVSRVLREKVARGDSREIWMEKL